MFSDLPQPQQSRSQKTLAKILEAAEALLEERLFDSLTMAELATQAGVSVGVIYTRFRQKEDLLPALLERHHEAVEQRLGRLLKRIGEAAQLWDRLEALVHFAVDYHLEHHGLLRALAVHVKAHPDSVPAQMLEEREGQYAAVGSAVIADGAEIAHPRPRTAVQFLLRAINSICREQLLFPRTTPSTAPRGLRPELVRLAFAYLTLEVSPR